MILHVFNKIDKFEKNILSFISTFNPFSIDNYNECFQINLSSKIFSSLKFILYKMLPSIKKRVHT